MGAFDTLLSYMPNDEPDPRSNQWFLIGTPYTVFILVFMYLYFVLKCGPDYMKKRQPYELKTFIRYYNLFQIVANAYIVYKTIKHGLFTTVPITCIELDRSAEGDTMEIAKLFYYVFLLKLLDFVETGVFVLRKKNRQVSFLHLYHHVGTMLFSWLAVKIYPGGMLIPHVSLNSWVHVVMYSYYLASSFGPAVQMVISSFKKYITIIQMVQFILLIAHTSQGFSPNCRVPRWAPYVVMLNLVFNFLLFFNFYRKNYMKSKTR